MERRRFLQIGSAFAAASAVRGRANAASDGFWVPPEEDPHELTFMQWPVSRAVYPDGAFLSAVQETIADVANAIADFEPVVMLADRVHHRAARRSLSTGVELWDIPTEDLWCRDSGPLVAVSGTAQRAVVGIRFNGWGNKQVHAEDGQIQARIAAELGLHVIEAGLTGEPGGVEQDGHGLLMAHESSWVIDNRNPGLTRDEVTARLLRAYGAKRMIWSPGVWDQDITDYHIDSLARFTGPGRVLMNLPDNPEPDDPFHDAAFVTHDRLQAAGLDVTVIPEPYSRRIDGPEFVASYVNYYVCNGAVIAAQFGDAETDAIARRTLALHYPGREIVTLNADALGEIGGGIHCATQQLPAARSAG